jgi:hypothetical protein
VEKADGRILQHVDRQGLQAGHESPCQGLHKGGGDRGAGPAGLWRDSCEEHSRGKGNPVGQGREPRAGPTAEPTSSWRSDRCTSWSCWESPG